MKPYVIATIVEGHGEVQAVPALLRRLLADIAGVAVARPVRVNRATVLGESLNRYLQIADANIREAGGQGGILVMIDADEDCAATLGPDIQRRVSELAPARKCMVVLPVREFETWILGGMSDIVAQDSDSLGSAKARLKGRFGRYSETADQARLISEADLELLAARSRSFRKFMGVVDEFRALARERT